LSAARHLPLRLWTMYWHFVGVVWALMLVSIFLI
jgi:heme/copper-type cytochrome/quinol oxidase subunit 3